jgi:hypothetical protein
MSHFIARIRIMSLLASCSGIKNEGVQYLRQPPLHDIDNHRRFAFWHYTTRTLLKQWGHFI